MEIRLMGRGTSGILWILQFQWIIMVKKRSEFGLNLIAEVRKQFTMKTVVVPIILEALETFPK